MKHETTKWRSQDDLEIFGQYWKTDEAERAVVALVHGFGEHSSRYEHVATAFADRGYSTFAFDHRGHGLSEGQRGHTPSYESLMSDLDIFLEKVKDLFPDVPVVLYGHSMGGNIAVNYLISRHPDVKCAVATGPFFRTASPPPKFQLVLGKMMNKVWGAFPDKARLDPNHISRDPEVVQRYVDDPLVHNKISARMGLALIEMGGYAIEHADEVDVPLLIVHGDADELTDCKSSVEFKNKAGDLVQLEVLKGYFHEVHNEPEKAGVLMMILHWMDGQLS